MGTPPYTRACTLGLTLFVARLRGIIRELLASSPLSVSAQFAATALGRLKRKLSGCGSPEIPSGPLFYISEEGLSRPTDAFDKILRAARSVCGAGSGLFALQSLTPVIKQTIGLRWEEDGEMANSLAVLDSDMTQAIQSSKEELMREKGAGVDEAKAVAEELRLRISEVLTSVESWGGKPPFERTEASLEHWKL